MYGLASMRDDSESLRLAIFCLTARLTHYRQIAML